MGKTSKYDEKTLTEIALPRLPPSEGVVMKNLSDPIKVE
jgi:hypothetical protein